MTPLAIELVYSSRPNLSYELSQQDAESFLTLYDRLGRAAVPGSLCWSCQARPIYQVLLNDGPEGQFLVTAGRVVRSRGSALRWETRADPDRTLTGFLVRRRPASLSSSLAPAIDSSSFPRCHPIPPPTYAPCACGAPGDFADWASPETLINNVCYNFALKDVWCDLGGRYPRGAPTNGDIARWNAALARDGLISTPDWNTVPPGSDTARGWHIALAIGPAGDGHFLRLDAAAQCWTHKFSTLLPQACDAAGRHIERDQIHAAQLCEYSVKAFFWYEPD